ncbi:MAG: VWA domain-containing protein [Deltaproteobacteria bacterium]|nr:VWA domain-containing protein [Deltaproteobacteria bacterium]
MRVHTIVPLLVVLASCSDINFIGEEVIEPVVINPDLPPTPSNTDSYEQIQKPMVDILWVVDNSCSMFDEQTEVANNFPVFMSYFLGSGLDYHIGVVSTDMDNTAHSGKLIQAGGARWITPETVNPEEVFAAMSQLGTGGSGDEQGLLAAYAAFELQTEWNEGFFRDEAAVHVVTVSDEPDNSPNDPVTLNEFADYLNALRFDLDAVTYNTIVSYPDLPDWPCASYGSRYVDIRDQVGGVLWSLCNPDWSGALEMLGLETAGLKKEYFLSERPVDGTIRVTVEQDGYIAGFDPWDDLTQLGDYTYSESRNSVTFIVYVPEPGAVVHVTYDVLSAVERE